MKPFIFRPHSMPTPMISRSRFLYTAAISITAAAFPKLALSAAPKSDLPWRIGCLNRPWTKWSIDETLDNVKLAGYPCVGLLTATADDPFIASGPTPEYLATLKQKITARGLEVTAGRIRTKDTAPFDDAVADLRQQLNNAHLLGLNCVVSTGTTNPKYYAQYYRVMAHAAAFAQELGMRIAIKPHGGVAAAGEEMLTCIKEINHQNLGIWYDAGNIIFYTGRDPVKEIEPIPSHVTAFVAKDCAGQRKEVAIQFGAGKVEFAPILSRLKQAGFSGPIMVETCAAAPTLAGTTANAKANREFLEKVVAGISVVPPMNSGIAKIP